jgi:hypothetical protein
MADPLLCVVCQQVEPREGVVCDRDRQRLAAVPWKIRDLHRLLPAALVPGRGARELIRGHREAPLPLRVDPLDLAGPVGSDSVTDTLRPGYRLVPSEERDWDLVSCMGQIRRQTALERVPVMDGNGEQVWVGEGDQIGSPSVAAVLWSWVREWSERADFELPARTDVPTLTGWLSLHTTWALDNHPWIDRYAFEVTKLLYELRATLNLSEAPIHSPLACPACKTAALRRQAGDKAWRCAECKAEVEVVHPDPCECGCERIGA